MVVFLESWRLSGPSLDGPKVTDWAQNADSRRKPQIFANSPLLLEFQALGGHRTFAENRRFSQKTAGNRRSDSVTFIRNKEKGVLAKGVSAESSVAPKKQKIPKGTGLGSTFGTQSATARRGRNVCKNALSCTV